MKLLKRSPKKSYEVIENKNLTVFSKDGELVLSFAQWDYRKCDYKVTIPADELIKLVNQACQTVSGNSPVDLKVIWSPKE